MMFMIVYQAHVANQMSPDVEEETANDSTVLVEELR